MALYVYMLADGRLHSYSQWENTPVPNEEQTSDLAARGMGWKWLEQQQDETHRWDPSTLTVIEVPAPYRSRDIPCSRFILAFTAEELASIRASADPVVAQLMLAVQVTPEIDMNRESTINGVGYLALVGLIQESRVAQILATE